MNFVHYFVCMLLQQLHSHVCLFLLQQNISHSSFFFFFFGKPNFWAEVQRIHIRARHVYALPGRSTGSILAWYYYAECMQAEPQNTSTEIYESHFWLDSVCWRTTPPWDAAKMSGFLKWWPLNIKWLHIKHRGTLACSEKQNEQPVR